MTPVGFAGTGAWSAGALRRLADERGIAVALVLTQPPRPAGRGRHARPTPVALAADELGIEVLAPERPAEAQDALVRRCRAMALVAYGALVPRPLLDALPWLNLHPSALPRWRGAAPVERALMHGDRELGVATMLLVEALDAGPIASCERFEAGPDATAGEVYERALSLGLEPLARALQAAVARSLPTVPQIGAPSYAPKLTAADRALDPAGPARRLHDAVRALSPHIGARLLLDGEATVIWQTRELREGPASGWLEREGDRLLLGCRDGSVEIVELQAPGRRRMSAADWLRGRRGPPARAAKP